MRDAAGDEHTAPGHHVGADDAAAQADEQGSEERMTEEEVFEEHSLRGYFVVGVIDAA